MAEKVNEEAFNDTLIIMSLADSTMISFTYSQNQTDLDKILPQSKKLADYVKTKTKGHSIS
jgi:hypothetical protein